MFQHRGFHPDERRSQAWFFKNPNNKRMIKLILLSLGLSTTDLVQLLWPSPSPSPSEPLMPLPLSQNASNCAVVNVRFQVSGHISSFDVQKFRYVLFTHFETAQNVSIEVEAGSHMWNPSVDCQCKIFCLSHEDAVAVKNDIEVTDEETLSSKLFFTIEYKSQPVVTNEALPNEVMTIFNVSSSAQ